MNYSLIIRIALLIFTALILFVFHSFSGYDFLLVLFLLVGLILNYKNRNNVLEIASNYLFWFLMLFMIAKFKGFSFLNLKDAFLILFVLKLSVLLANYVKFKKISVTSTYLSKLWIFTVFLYLSEVVLNSTHGLKNICFLIGVISAIENFIIIIKSDKWRQNAVSVFNT